MSAMTVAARTFSSNLAHTCFLIASYRPFFFNVCESPSIADRVAEGSGRSDALNFLTTGWAASIAEASTVIDMVLVVERVAVRESGRNQVLYRQVRRAAGHTVKSTLPCAYVLAR